VDLHEEIAIHEDVLDRGNLHDAPSRSCSTIRAAVSHHADQRAKRASGRTRRTGTGNIECVIADSVAMLSNMALTGRLRDATIVVNVVEQRQRAPLLRWNDV
jgi:hypothetical protein